MKDIREVIQQKRLVMDGALGTQLEPVLPKHPLWSGVAVLTHPELIEQIHKEYIDAGANIIITATYQLSQSMLCKHTELTEEDIEQVWMKAVDIAAKAKDNRDVFIVGSIGPYSASLGSGGEYGNIVEVSDEYLQQYHTPLFQYLSNNVKVDVIGIETVATLQEFTVFHEMNHSKPYYISIISNDGITLVDGTSIPQLVNYINNHTNEWFIGLGINCTEYTLISNMIKDIDLPLILYPNLGYIVEHNQAKPKQKNDKDWIKSIEDWLKNENVRVVGGCCGTTPVQIKQISAVINR